MNSTTTSKKIISNDLVTIPRKEYEALLELKKTKEFRPTQAQKRALRVAERNLSQNKTLSYNELVQKLGFGN